MFHAISGWSSGQEEQSRCGRCNCVSHQELQPKTADVQDIYVSAPESGSAALLPSSTSQEGQSGSLDDDNIWHQEQWIHEGEW